MFLTSPCFTSLSRSKWRFGGKWYSSLLRLITALQVSDMAVARSGDTIEGDILEEDWSQPLYKNGRYENPWPTWKKSKLSSALTFILLTKSESNIPCNSELDKTLPITKPDFSQYNSSPEQGIRHMWIGHASSLVQFDGITLLTDPIFSDRCSPLQGIGVKRYRPPPCTIQDLPKIDCVVISHNHYDHLDYNSVKELNRRFGDSLRWYVPMGLKKWMNDCGCNNVVELTWWQEHSHDSGVKFISTPCQHWCKRSLNDNNQVLWSSWCVKGPKHSFYFAGDTGYCPVFKQIGRRHGPFTLSTIPIGAYHPRSFLGPQHVDPGQAVDVHNDIASQKSIGIHWGTFDLSKEFYLEPRDLLRAELKKRELDPGCFITVNHGEIVLVGGKQLKQEI
jgi:N-acyl-phosphatidylethanolamine-hydrolysing phospholipase D